MMSTLEKQIEQLIDEGYSDSQIIRMLELTSNFNDKYTGSYGKLEFEKWFYDLKNFSGTIQESQKVVGLGPGAADSGELKRSLENYYKIGVKPNQIVLAEYGKNAKDLKDLVKREVPEVKVYPANVWPYILDLYKKPNSIYFLDFDGIQHPLEQAVYRYAEEVIRKRIAQNILIIGSARVARINSEPAEKVYYKYMKKYGIPKLTEPRTVGGYHDVYYPPADVILKPIFEDIAMGYTVNTGIYQGRGSTAGNKKGVPMVWISLK